MRQRAAARDRAKYRSGYFLEMMNLYTPVPEPTSWALFGLGLGFTGLVWRWRRRCG
ncbi:MAG: PEP-CTERM sorting domain-containing protein [Candidatus Eisenbacteria sp.]|nr:PEP-CTERM sorting domain-containing protein [Candidatus Eisenbacteria bacterium]